MFDAWLHAEGTMQLPSRCWSVRLIHIPTQLSTNFDVQCLHLRDPTFLVDPTEFCDLKALIHQRHLNHGGCQAWRNSA